VVGSSQVLERRQGLNFRVNMKARGDTFGEVSLMYNVPRSATVAATRDSVVWVLERDQFRCHQSPGVESFLHPLGQSTAPPATGAIRL
jgi:CRP-like cAMP-binding protein